MSRSYYLEQGKFYAERSGDSFKCKGRVVSAKIVIEDSELGEYYIPICRDTLTVALNVNDIHSWLSWDDNIGRKFKWRNK